jgi:hypothetical protein
MSPNTENSNRQICQSIKYINSNCLALCLLLQLGENWFRISRYVYDRNRPLAPKQRQRRCRLMYDVY